MKAWSLLVFFACTADGCFAYAKWWKGDDKTGSIITFHDKNGNVLQSLDASTMEDKIDIPNWLNKKTSRNKIVAIEKGAHVKSLGNVKVGFTKGKDIVSLGYSMHDGAADLPKMDSGECDRLKKEARSVRYCTCFDSNAHAILSDYRKIISGENHCEKDT